MSFTGSYTEDDPEVVKGNCSQTRNFRTGVEL